MGQQAENAYAGFLDKEVDHRAYEPYVFNEKQGFQTQHSGFLNVGIFLDKTAEWFKSENAFLDENLDAHDLVFSENSVAWKTYKAKGIIFCEGMNSVHNPLFSWVPVNASKGEVVQVKIEQFRDDVIFNKNVFMVPAGKQEYKVGSTYHWKFENELPTQTGKLELTERLSDMIRKPFEVTDHWAGIRPASRDRKPYLGRHPEFSNAFIFNGLGAKGVSLAPYFSERMADCVLEGVEPESSVNIARLIKNKKNSNEKKP
jgi:glycine/D-amino acid oxidase-like deaminating enzyme